MTLLPACTHILVVAFPHWPLEIFDHFLHQQSQPGMISEQSTVFPKQLKLDDYEPPTEANIIRVMETSNLLLGNGGRSSPTSIILAKCLHMLQQERILDLRGFNVLEFGCGVGLLGIYLGALGVNVVMTDLPQLRDMVERNINLNRCILKGDVSFSVLNWSKTQPPASSTTATGYTMEQAQKQSKSTTESDIATHSLIDKLDYTLACECGGLEDLQHQLRWMGRRGAIVAFREREHFLMEDTLTARALEEHLLKEGYEYERVEGYHPDYEDDRVNVYRVWR